MLMDWWRKNAPVFGTAAQWAGGLGAIGTLCVASYGLSKAVPYFENVNLRELNAQLQLSNRKLSDEREELNKGLEDSRKSLEKSQGEAEFVRVALECMWGSAAMTGFLNEKVNKFNAMQRFTLMNSSGDIPAELVTEAVLVRDVRKALNEGGKSLMKQEMQAELRAARDKVMEGFGEKLDLVILPALNAKVRPTDRDFLRANVNGDVASELSMQLYLACNDMLKRMK